MFEFDQVTSGSVTFRGLHFSLNATVEKLFHSNYMSLVSIIHQNLANLYCPT